MFRCTQAKGEGAPECEKFAKYYRSLCPSEWVCVFPTLMSGLSFMFHSLVLCLRELTYDLIVYSTYFDCYFGSLIVTDK